MKRLAIVALLLGFLVQSCAPVLIGSLAYSVSKKRKARQEWSQTFNQQNLDRESRGLKPLDWCTEASRFDRAWAAKDDNCREQLGMPPKATKKKHK